MLCLLAEKKTKGIEEVFFFVVVFLMMCTRTMYPIISQLEKDKDIIANKVVQ